MATEFIYNKKGSCIGAIDPTYRKENTTYSAIFFANRQKDDHEKEFNLKSEARKYINQQNLKSMATPAKKTGKKKATPRKKKTATKKPAGKKAATKRCEPTPAQRAARKEFAANAKKAAQLVRSGKAKNIKAAWKQIK